MTLLQALILGIVQGLTEFIPISSSGHLSLIPFIVGWDSPSVAFDVAAHLGTLVAVAWVFRDLLSRYLVALRSWSTAPPEDKAMLKMLAIGTAPAVVVGLVFNDFLTASFERPVLAAFLLGVTGYILLSAETRAEAAQAEPRHMREIGSRDAWTIGAAQAVAILPGISRSGATIAAGMRRGISRPDAARFSFLLAIPAILAAGALHVPDFVRDFDSSFGEFAVGFLAATASGMFAVRWFLDLIQRRGMRPFGYYCFLAMTAGLITGLARG